MISQQHDNLFQLKAICLGAIGCYCFGAIMTEFANFDFHSWLNSYGLSTETIIAWGYRLGRQLVPFGGRGL